LASNPAAASAFLPMIDLPINSPLRDFAQCFLLLHLAPKIIEDTDEVAIKIGGHKLA
jgi:hypothetical protein